MGVHKVAADRCPVTTLRAGHDHTRQTAVQLRSRRRQTTRSAPPRSAHRSTADSPSARPADADRRRPAPRPSPAPAPPPGRRASRPYGRSAWAYIPGPATRAPRATTSSSALVAWPSFQPYGLAACLTRLLRLGFGRQVKDLVPANRPGHDRGTVPEGAVAAALRTASRRSPKLHLDCRIIQMCH